MERVAGARGPILPVCFRVLSLLLLLVSGSPVSAQKGPDPVEDDYYYARGLDRKGHVDLAIQEYQKFLRRHKGHARTAEVLYLLGVAAHKVGDFSLGEKTLKQLTDTHKDFSFLAEALFRRGDCLFKLERLEEAATAYGTAAGLGGKDGYLADQGLYWQGEALFRAGNHAGCVKALEKLRKTHPRSKYLKDGLLTLGYAHYHLDAGAVALEVFEEILRRFPGGHEAPEALYWKGASCLKAGMLEAAARAFETFVNHYPRHDHRMAAIESLGWARFGVEDFRGAARAYDLLAREVPVARASKPLLQAARARYHGKAFEEARSQAEKVLGRGGPEAARGGYLAALSALALKDSSGAVALFKRALEAGADPALRTKILIHAAGALYDLDQWIESAASYDAALAGPEIGDLAGQALFHAGLAFHRAGELDRAEARFNSLIQKHPKSPWVSGARFGLAENAYKAGDYPRAAGRYRKYLLLHGRDEAREDVSDYKAEAYFKLGCACYHAGDRKGTVDALQHYLASDPEGPFVAEVHYYLGRAFLDLGQPGPACDQFRRCAGAHPKSEFAARSILALGRVAAAAGKEEEALGHFDRLKKGVPGSDVYASARFNAARVHLDGGDLKKAEAELTKTLESSRDPDLRARALFSLAKVLVRTDHFREAVARARSVLAMEGGTLHAEAQEILGFALLKAGKTEEALKTFAVFLKRYPRHGLAPFVKLNRGIALGRIKDHAGAAAILKVLDRDHPGFARGDHVLYHLGLSMAAQKDPGAMVKAFTALLTRRPGSTLVPEVRFRLGEHFYDLGRFKEATGHFRAVNEAGTPDPDLGARARYKEAWCGVKLKKKEEAAAAFDHLAGDHPRSRLRGESLFQAGLCLLECGRAREGLERLSAMVQAYPHHQLLSRAQVKAGICCLNLEKWTEALSWFGAARKGHVEAVDLPRVHHGIGVASQNLGRFDSAIQAFEAVAMRYEGGLAAECQFRIGQCHAARKDPAAAVGAWLKVSILHEHPDWVPRSLLEAGKICLASGQNARAVKVFEELIRKHPDSPWIKEARRLLKTARSPRK